MVKIDKNIPVPAGTRAGGAEIMFPFEDMEVGDSFFVALLPGKTEEQMVAKLRHAYRKYAKQQEPEPRFTAKIVEEEGVAGIRTWRLT